MGAVVYGPVAFEGYVDIVQDAQGNLEGVAEFSLDEVDGLLVEIPGLNDGGNIEVPFSLEFCDAVVKGTLVGTINPEDTLNFPEFRREGVCGGQFGTIVIDAFTMKR